ncbi:MAG: hypothetical protein WHT08_06285, partial [Bryobacteraceae bacterium]
MAGCTKVPDQADPLALSAWECEKIPTGFKTESGRFVCLMHPTSMTQPKPKPKFEHRDRRQVRLGLIDLE